MAVYLTKHYNKHIVGCVSMGKLVMNHVLVTAHRVTGEKKHLAAQCVLEEAHNCLQPSPGKQWELAVTRTAAKEILNCFQSNMQHSCQKKRKI